MKTARAAGGIWALAEPSPSSPMDMETDLELEERNEKRISEPTVVLSDYSSNSDSSSSSSGDDSDCSSRSNSSIGGDAEDLNQSTNSSATHRHRVKRRGHKSKHVRMGSSVGPGNTATMDSGQSGTIVSEPDSTQEIPEQTQPGERVNGSANKIIQLDNAIVTETLPVQSAEIPQSTQQQDIPEGLQQLDTRWGCFGAGEKVFAYWKGNTAYSTGYYPGVIVRKGVLNVYIIHFDDNTDCNTSEVQIIPVRVLGVGTKVFYVPDELFAGGPMSAQVVGQKMLDDGNIQYGVKPYGADSVVVCERRQIYLSVTEGKELRRKYESVQPKFGDVNLDNVVSGPRQRRDMKTVATTPVVPSQISAPKKDSRRRKSETAVVASSAKKVKRSAKSERPAAKTSVCRPKPCTIDFKHPQKSTPEPQISDCNVLRKITPSEARHALSYVRAQTKQKTQKSAKKTSQAAIAISSNANADNRKNSQLKRASIPAKISSTSPTGRAITGLTATECASPSKVPMFRGYFFYLTAGDRTQLKGIDTGNYSKDIPKAEMLRMIEGNEGQELVSIKGELGKDPERVFLLASSHLRTLKYLYCIATGIPCVAQKWIKACVDEGRVVDWKPFQLYPGWNVRENCLAAPHSNWPLKGMKIGLATFKNEVIHTWNVLVPAAKGRLFISKDFNSQSHPAELKIPDAWLNGSIDILVSDFYCPKAVGDLLKSKNIPLVRIEWLVETITIGKKADYRIGELGIEKSGKSPQ